MNILLAVAGLGLVIFFHELGHFIGAHLAGMRVRQFALGFGWRLFGFRKNGTDYRVNTVPFGGYVLVDGIEDEETATDEERKDPRKMQNRPVWARSLFALSGPLLNFALAIGIILTLALTQGIPSGRHVYVSYIDSGSPAQAAGLQAGDRILAIGNQPVRASGDVSAAIQASGDTVTLTVQRSGEEIPLTAFPAQGRIGIGIHEEPVYSTKNLSAGTLINHTWNTVMQMSTMVIRAFSALFTGKAGLNQLSGPVGMVTDVARTVSTGWANFLMVLALISINLGLFNLFPFPALDGGRLLLLALEGIFGLKMSQTRQAIFHLVGFAAIFLLIFLVSIQDVAKMVR